MLGSHGEEQYLMTGLCRRFLLEERNHLINAACWNLFIFKGKPLGKTIGFLKVQV